METLGPQTDRLVTAAGTTAGRRTKVVEGPLAFRMRSAEAAMRGDAGVQIMTLPLLAARLAGGFVRPAGSQDLVAAIRTALDHGGLRELEGIRSLPGAPRAVAATLARVWRADLALSGLAARNARLADLADIERRVRDGLPRAVLSPRDLRDLALARTVHAGAVLGAVELDRLTAVATVWRPLLRALGAAVPLSFTNPGTPDLDWFPGAIAAPRGEAAAAMTAVSCADPRAEAVEALRAVRELIATGRARPADIAVCAAATEDYDEHFAVLAGDLPLHFSHGVPVLASREGQCCAALADVLLSGLGQEGVRRLFAHVRAQAGALTDLPPDWARGLRPGAALFELDDWRRALSEAAAGGGADPRPVVMPVIELLARGTQAAAAAGEMLLSGRARALWTEALRRAPAQALEFSLRDMRVPDGRDPSSCAVWCPASHLAAAPRRFVRLLGMTSQSWPRRTAEDPLIPSHVLPAGVLDPDPVTAQDRRAFALITARASGACVLSASRRSAAGSLLARSPLVPQDAATEALRSTRVPAHAFNEADRLLARPAEAAAVAPLAAATQCWRDWQRGTVTPHDGRVREDHPAIVAALGRVQSAASLRLMLQTPLAFVWRHALGWRSAPEEDQPLTLDPRAWGELVHELLKETVDRLEPVPGFSRASRHEIEAALADAAATVGAAWPLMRPVPPALLWHHTLAAAGRMALKALTLDKAFQPGTRSFTELAFGRDGGPAPSSSLSSSLPWPPGAAVVIPGTEVRLQGTIDRLDVTGDRRSARVTDYKTGPSQRRSGRIVLQRGAELQRVVYALAARTLLADAPPVVARLVFLGDDEPGFEELHDVEAAIAELGSHVNAAAVVLRAGMAVPGTDARDEHEDFRLALAAAEGYFRVKNAAFRRALAPLARPRSGR